MFRIPGERGSALVELAVSAPLFALLIYGISQIAYLSLCKYRLLSVTHAVMREAVGGTTDALVLTALANGYARAGGKAGVPEMVVTMETADCGSDPGVGGILGFISSKFAPGVRIRVATVVRLSGVMGRMWPKGIPMESSVVVLTDPWVDCFDWLKDLLGVK